MCIRSDTEPDARDVRLLESFTGHLLEVADLQKYLSDNMGYGVAQTTYDSDMSSYSFDEARLQTYLAYCREFFQTPVQEYCVAELYELAHYMRRYAFAKEPRSPLKQRTLELLEFFAQNLYFSEFAVHDPGF